jgi:hypothetical protein
MLCTVGNVATTDSTTLVVVVHLQHCADCLGWNEHTARAHVGKPGRLVDW